MKSIDRGHRPEVRFKFHGCFESRAEAEKVSKKVGGSVSKFRKVPEKGAVSRPEGYSYRVIEFLPVKEG